MNTLDHNTLMTEYETGGQLWILFTEARKAYRDGVHQTAELAFHRQFGSQGFNNKNWWYWFLKGWTHERKESQAPAHRQAICAKRKG